MLRKACAALSQKLSSVVSLSKSRVETLSLLIIGMASARTVNLTHIASERPSDVKVASSYRRLQRFFQHVRPGQDWTANVVIGLLGIKGPWVLCLDRTNWKVGSRDVNILLLAVVTRRHRVPLLWTVLDKAGTSDTAERTALMRRYLAIFGASSIKFLLADREFIGAEWFNFLNDNNIPFAIRIKERFRVTDENGRDLPIALLLRKTRRAQQFSGRLNGTGTHPAIRLNFAAKRLANGEWLVVASNRDGAAALKAYRKRWAIECLFGDAKTRGFNLEDTRLTNPEKIDLLLGVLALAMAWASKTAARLIGTKKNPRKSHGYYAKSWFRIGFDHLRHMLRNNPENALACWNALKPQKMRVV